MSEKGFLVIVSGPSAAGKGTVVRRAVNIAYEKGNDIHLSISMTTRDMKKDESDGVTYYYVSRGQFERAISDNQLIEFNEYNGNLYGTPRQVVEDKLNKGENVVLEIDVNGADQVIRQYPEAVRVFIMPPSIKELKDRIYKRGRETDSEVEQRLEKAKEEIPRAIEYDYIILNDIIEEAAEDLLHIIAAEKNNVCRKKHIIREILS